MAPKRDCSNREPWPTQPGDGRLKLLCVLRVVIVTVLRTVASLRLISLNSPAISRYGHIEHAIGPLFLVLDDSANGLG
jgi:hypothetical protein